MKGKQEGQGEGERGVREACSTCSSIRPERDRFRPEISESVSSKVLVTKSIERERNRSFSCRNATNGARGIYRQGKERRKKK